MLTTRNTLMVLLLALFAATAQAEDKVTVFAAASLTNAVTDISNQYQQANAAKVVTSFAASSTLAKQVENGAPADIFMSADSKWMNYLQDKNKIDVPTRRNLLGNQLLLIAPKGKAFPFQFDGKADLAKAFDGKLCTGDIDSVPVGIYAKQALTKLGWWDGVKTRIVGAQDVRAALVFVERGECAAGIVYATDAKVSSKVDVVAVFPEGSHDPIVYPIAQVAGANAASKGLYQYLLGPEAAKVFTQYGFSLLK